MDGDSVATGAESVGEEGMLNHQKAEAQRKSYSIKEKRVILERFDALPGTMSKKQKAECLGVKYATLMGILPQRERIFSTTNTESRGAIQYIAFFHPRICPTTCSPSHI